MNIAEIQIALNAYVSVYNSFSSKFRATCTGAQEDEMIQAEQTATTDLRHALGAAIEDIHPITENPYRGRVIGAQVGKLRLTLAS